MKCSSCHSKRALQSCPGYKTCQKCRERVSRYKKVNRDRHNAWQRQRRADLTGRPFAIQEQA